MTEKQTFKNPGKIVKDHGYAHPHWNLFDFEQGINEAFSTNEWDMEVTFTKKPVPFTLGEQVRDRYSGAYLYTVIGQWKHTVVVVDPNDDEIEYFDGVDLKREV